MQLANGTYHSAKEWGVDGAELRVDLGWIHLVSASVLVLVVMCRRNERESG